MQLEYFNTAGQTQILEVEEVFENNVPFLKTDEISVRVLDHTPPAVEPESTEMIHQVKPVAILPMVKSLSYLEAIHALRVLVKLAHEKNHGLMFGETKVTTRDLMPHFGV